MYMYLLVPLRVTRLPSRITFSVFTSFFLPYLHSSFLLTYFLSLPPVLHSLLFSTFFPHASPHLARHARFPSYCLSYILTYFLPYPIFLRTPRHGRLARFTYLISLSSCFILIFYFYTCLYIFYTQSLSPPPSTSVSFSFVPFSLSFLFLFSLTCASFSSDPFYFRYPLFASFFFI